MERGMANVAPDLGGEAFPRLWEPGGRVKLVPLRNWEKPKTEGGWWQEWRTEEEWEATARTGHQVAFPA